LRFDCGWALFGNCAAEICIFTYIQASTRAFRFGFDCVPLSSWIAPKDTTIPRRCSARGAPALRGAPGWSAARDVPDAGTASTSAATTERLLDSLWLPTPVPHTMHCCTKHLMLRQNVRSSSALSAQKLLEHLSALSTQFVTNLLALSTQCNFPNTHSVHSSLIGTQHSVRQT